MYIVHSTLYILYNLQYTLYRFRLFILEYKLKGRNGWLTCLYIRNRYMHNVYLH